MKRYCFLYNPSTNRQRSLYKWEKLKNLTETWPGAEYWVSQNRAHLQELTLEAAKTFDMVIACGGDGTVRDIAVRLYQSDANVELGVIPLGSGNDFSKSLDLPDKLHAQLDLLKKGNTRQVDLGMCNDFYFVNTLGFGFDGQTNLYASQSNIKAGTIRYILAALKTILKMKPFKAKISIGEPEEEIVEDSWIMITVANGRVEGGNFIVAPQASIFDRVFTLLTITTVNRWLLPFLLPLFLVGRPELSSKVIYHSAKSIRIQFDRPVYIHTDGEQIKTTETDFRIQILPGALDVVC